MDRTQQPTTRVAALAAGLWLLAAALAPGAAEAQRPPIKVGALYSLTGVYSGPSRDGINGFKLAFDEVKDEIAGAQMTRPFGVYACRTLGYKKVVAIGFDSVFGREEADAFENGCSESGGRVVLKVFPPVETADFAPYLAQVAAAAPDAVWAIWSGAAAIRFLQQYQEFGLKGKFPLIGFGALTDDAVLRAVGDTALGVVTTYFYVTTLDLPENRRFVQAYRQKFGEDPGIFANGGYMAARVIREAAAAVNGDVENAPKFLEALRRVRFDSPRGPFRLDPYQNPIENVYIQKVDRVGGKVTNVVVDTLKDVEQFWPKGKPQP